MRLKIAIVGASEAGKTSVANALGNETIPDTAGARIPYRPTDSVRIVELSLTNIELKKYTLELDVQLWEVGGNPRLKAIWPAVQKDMDGIIIVYDVNNDLHIKDASALHMHFVTHSNSGINPQQCFFVGNIFRGMREQGPQKILGASVRARSIAINVDDDPNQLRQDFRQFVTSLAQIVYEREKANYAGCKEKNIIYVSRKLTTADAISEINAGKDKSRLAHISEVNAGKEHSRLAHISEINAGKAKSKRTQSRRSTKSSLNQYFDTMDVEE